MSTKQSEKKLNYFSSVLAALFILFSLPSHAAPYPEPNKTIKVIVPFSAGSGTDATTRVVMEELQKMLGVSIAVENKPGANGTVAADSVKKANPDGYTLFMGTSSAFSANPWLFKDLSYDPIKDFTPIVRTTDFPFILAVSSDSPIKQLSDFSTFIQTQRTITMGYGNATGQVANAHLMKAARFEAVSVPYKSTPPALVDMVGGRFDLMFVDLASSNAFVKDGRVRPIAMMADRRSALMPDLPALGEKYPGFSYIPWGGLFGPPALPQDIVDKLNREVVNALAKPSVLEKFKTMGQATYPSTPAEFANFIVEQKAAWGEKIQQAGMVAQ